MSDNVRSSHVFVECHIAYNKTGVSGYIYDLSFEGDFIPEGRQLSAADLREIRDCIDAALKMTGQEKGGEK